MAVRGAPARRRVGCKLVLLASLLALVLSNGVAAADVLAPSNPIGVHSMRYLTHPLSAKQAMFEEASAVGASTIRLDIELSGVFPDPMGPADWSGVDQYMWARRRGKVFATERDTLTGPYLRIGGVPSDAEPTPGVSDVYPATKLLRHPAPGSRALAVRHQPEHGSG